jgi:hypothetical protein
MNHHQQSWFQLNWKWAVPLGGCFTMIVLAIIATTTLVSKVGSLINDTEPYQLALEKAQKSEWVISRLGEPIEEQGNSYQDYSYNNGRTVLSFTTNLKGSNDIDASLDVSANKVEEKWVFTKMNVTIDDSDETHSLLEEERKANKEEID